MRGNEILAAYGYFYCILCDAYVKSNKKNVVRHQTKNRKHLTQLSELPASIYTLPPLNNTDNGDETNELGEKRKFGDIEKFDGVTLNTVNRWKTGNKLGVECFLGMGAAASEADRQKGADILGECIVCECIVYVYILGTVFVCIPVLIYVYYLFYSVLVPIFSFTYATLFSLHIYPYYIHNHSINILLLYTYIHIHIYR